jgi:methyl acetate hydrolase
MPGFVYAHDDTLVSQWLKANPTPGIFDPKAGVEALSTPLIYEPGTSYKYGVSIDWAGILVERVSGLNLENYFRQNIFEPIGAKSMTFYPTPQVKAKKMAVCSRDAEGKVQVIPGGFGMGRPQEPEQVGLLLGGAGLFGTQKDYLAVLRAVLQCDPRYAERPDKPLLSPESYAEMFKPSLTRGEGYTGCDRLFEMVDRPKYFDSPSPDNVNHSVAFLINQSPWKGRRQAPSGCWSGAAKTQFWIDPESGIAVSVWVGASGGLG